MSKKAQPIREDHLERQETAQELRLKIQRIFKLSSPPDAKTVRRLLSQIERQKQTGYIA